MRKTAMLGCILVLVGCTTMAPDGRSRPWAGARGFWSLTMPGFGQFMNDEPMKGLLMMGIHVASNAYYYSSESDSEAEERYHTWSAVGTVNSIWSAADAYNTALRLNNGVDAGHGGPSETAPIQDAETGAGTITLDPIAKSVALTVTYTF